MKKKFTKRPFTIFDVAYRTGLSYSRAATLVREAVARGEVEIVGKSKESTGGRPSTKYAAV